MKPQKRFIVDKKMQEKLQVECNISALSASLLLQRGIRTKKEADLFLNGTIDNLTAPEKYIGMTKIVERLRMAVENKERIVIYGDYDCDGIGATAIYYLAFKSAGMDVFYYIPTRKDEGYGLNTGAIEKIYSEYAPKILLTADCGIASHKEIRFAQEKGIEVIVTDHHTPTGEILPCLATDPCFTPELTQLCAAGVALFVIRALFGEKESQKYTDICAISTIADIVPLVGDNRILVKHGLDKIHRGQTRPGIKTLVQYAKCNIRTLTTSDVSFRLAPRLNAAGRLSTPIDSLRLLIEEDGVVVNLLAENLSVQNAERQQLSATIYKEALEQLKGYDFGKYRLIMLYGKWNEGVVGIVCSKLTEFFHLPTILLCEQEEGVLGGSARSIEGVHLYQLLEGSKEYMLSYGGHAMAAGLRLEKDKFLLARDKMNDKLKALDQELFIRPCYYDEDVSINSFDWELFDELTRFAPFGANNPSPLFYDDKPTLRFRKGSDKYPIIKARCGIGEAVSFDGSSQLPLLETNDYSILYSVDKNTFNGMETPQFSIKDFLFDKIDYEDPESFFDNFFTEEYPYRERTEKLTLYVCFYAKTAKNMLDNLPKDTPLYYRTTSKLEPVSSVVLSPTRDFPYYFFGKVVFCDLYNPTLGKKLAKSGIKIENQKNERLNIYISVDYLRTIFVYYNKMKVFGGKNSTYLDFFDANDASLGSQEQFVSASYILEECGLLERDENGTYRLVSQKVDPTISAIFRYLRGTL